MPSTKGSRKPKSAKKKGSKATNARRSVFRKKLDRKFDPIRWKSLFQPRRTMSVVEWNEKNIVLSAKSTNQPGPFSTTRIPFAREPINSFADRDVESVTCVMGSQICKTVIQQCCISYAVCEDPGPCMWVWPNADLAKKFAKSRFQQIIDDCTQLRELKMKTREAWTNTDKQFTTMDVMFRGSNSPANLSSVPIRYLLLDEVDKYPTATEKEAGAVELAIHRTQSFWNRTIMSASSPTITDGQIWRRFLAGDQRYFWVPCPYCHEFQVLRTSQIQCDESCRLSETEWDWPRVRETAFYYCDKCGEAIPNEAREAMNLNGEWRPAGQKGNHRSYQLSRLYSPWANARWGQILEEFFRSYKDPEKLHDFTNNWEGLPWENQAIDADEELILSHRADYDEGVIPGQPFAVCLTVDVQEDRIYWVMRAWGVRGTSWLVRYGISESIRDIPTIASARVPFFVAGSPAQVCQIRPEDVWIDSGAFTDEVYRLCRQHGYTPIKGENDNTKPWEYPVRLSKTVRNLKLIEGNRFRHELFRKFEEPIGPDGSWYLHKQAGRPYAKQLLGDKPIREKDAYGRERIVWKERWANHWGDCETYQLAFALWKNVRDWQGPSGPRRVRAEPFGTEAPNGPGGY